MSESDYDLISWYNDGEGEDDYAFFSPTYADWI